MRVSELRRTGAGVLSNKHIVHLACRECCGGLGFIIDQTMNVELDV